MRRSDKLKNMKRVNMLFEQRIIAESFHEPDGTPIGVDANHRPVVKEYGDGGMPYETGHDDNGEGNVVDPSLTNLPGYDKIMMYPKQFQAWVYEDDSWAITYVHKQGIKDIPELFAFWKREGFNEPHPNDDGKTFDQAQGETHGY